MKRWAVPTITFLLLLASANSALACLPPPTVISVRCSNAKFTLTSITPMPPNDPRHSAAAAACAENLNALVPQLDQAIESWQNSGYHYGFLGGTELTFEPYPSEREQAILKTQRALLDCTYPAYSRLGEWLKIWTERREYCASSLAPADLLGSPCGTLTLKLSLTFFIGYAFQHPGWETAPYLALLLLAIGLVIAALGYKARQGRFITTIKPSLSKLAFILVVGVMVICAGGLFDTLLIMGIIYIVISFLLPTATQQPVG